ncbi:MAG: patatin-like phospholipase family protein [Gemmatimonadales bacterium]|nr:patatin-like phospholipase family protein [Gemmatimonadales bacterium]
MPRPLLSLVVLLVATMARPALAQESSCAVSPTVLVLSGGGAKGLAHIGVLRALEAAGVRPDLIVGTSMGAMIGALAASGYSGAELDSLVRSLPLDDVFRSYSPTGPRAWGSLLPLVIWEEGERGFVVQGAAVRLSAVNRMLNTMLLRGNLTARGDFDRLPIPLRLVATDLQDRSPVVLSGGDLAQAVRASTAIPLVFPPERIDGMTLTDGGLSDNIPVGVARELGAARVIVSDVSEEPLDTLNLESPFVVAARLLTWLFRQPIDSVGPGDLYISNNVSRFGSLDFSRANVDSLLVAGRITADAALATWSCLGVPTSPPPREPTTLPTRLTAIVGAPQDSVGTLIFQQALGLSPGGRVDLEEWQPKLAALADGEIFKEIWLGPRGDGDTLVLVPTLRRLPRRIGGLGLAYDNELGGRLWAGFLDRQVPVINSEGSAILQLGSFRSDLTLAVRRATLFGQPTFTPVATIKLADEDLRRFDDDGIELPADDMREVVMSAGVESNLPAGYRLTLTGEWRSWIDTDLVDRTKSDATAIGARFSIEKLTTDRARLAHFEAVVTDVYRMATLETRLSGHSGPFRIEQSLRAGVGRRLPAQLTLPLGGENGFPGLHLGERRGDRELFTSLAVSRRVFGPLRVRVTAAVGRTAFNRDPATLPSGADPTPFRFGNLFGGDGWLAGARAGLGTDTPLGPVIVEYGRSSENRGAVFLRVGRWF